MTVLRTRGGNGNGSHFVAGKASNEDFTLSLWSFLKKLPKDQRFELQGGEIGVEVGDSLDAAKIIFQRDVLVRSMGVFIGQAEADQDARHFKSVIHLRYEGDGTALANENCFLAKPLFQSRLGLLENGIVIRSD